MSRPKYLHVAVRLAAYWSGDVSYSLKSCQSSYPVNATEQPMMVRRLSNHDFQSVRTERWALRTLSMKGNCIHRLVITQGSVIVMTYEGVGRHCNFAQLAKPPLTLLLGKWRRDDFEFAFILLLLDT